MAGPERLDDTEIARRLAQAPRWQRRGDALHRALRFAGFDAAFAFMTDVAAAAERLQHHPDWRNVYDRVTVELTTHDAGGITARDFELLAAIDAAAQEHGGA